MAPTAFRYAIAVVLGVLFDAVFFWKFQPYTVREHGHDLLPWYFLPLIAFAAGLLLTLGFEGKRRWIPVAMICGFSAANACLIVHDCATDPTNHNLWPFEFIIIAVVTSPAFIGAGISRLVARRNV